MSRNKNDCGNRAGPGGQRKNQRNYRNSFARLLSGVFMLFGPKHSKSNIYQKNAASNRERAMGDVEDYEEEVTG